MAKELIHKDAGASLSRTEDNAVDRHYLTGGANNDIPVYDSANAKLVGKTPAEVSALLDHGTLQGLGDDDHTQYIKHSLATAVSDFLVASGVGAFVKKTLAETLIILGKGVASGLASLNASTKVTEQPASISDHLDDTAGGTDGATTKAPTSNVMYDHGVATTGVHGVGASTVASVANIATHAGLTTGTHGVGAGTIAKTSDIVITSKVLATTRDLAAAPGDVSYTGVGFIPTVIVALGYDDGVTFFHSIGFADSAKTSACLDMAETGIMEGGTILILVKGAAGGNAQSAIVKTYDADGFTLTWAKAGTPTGTIGLKFLCLK